MQTEVNVIDTDDREHSLIRAVGKGYFVRDDKDVVFIPKENALRLEQHLKKADKGKGRDGTLPFNFVNLSSC